jgi:putative copper resistance protein D
VVFPSGPTRAAGPPEPADPVDPPAPATGPATAPSGSRWSVAVVSVAAALVTVCVAVALAASVGRRVLIPGLPDAGRVVEFATPGIKALFDLSAALTVGWLFAAVVLVPPQRNGVLEVGGYRAVRAASLAAVVWAAAALALVPLTFADTYGYSLLDALSADNLITGVTVSDQVRGYLVAATLAALVAVLARVTLRVGWAVLLLVMAVAGVLPQALTGHSAQSSDHDTAVDTMVWHLLGVSVWVGGLVALLGLARQRVPRLPVIARRYSAAAGVAFVVVAASGFGNAWIRFASIEDLFLTDYGRLVLAKASLLVVLGVLGWWHRRRTLPALDGAAGSRALIRLATVESLVMAATIGVAAALARTASPPGSPVVPTDLELTLGFDLPGPPTAWRLLTAWRFDWLVGVLALVAAGVYVAAVLRLRRRGDRWPVGRTAAWLGGCLVVVLATSSGLGRYSVALFSVHMMAHMLLGMVAPILLVLGGPITLALRALPAARRGAAPGLREAVVAVTHSRVVRFLTHPIVAFLLFIGSFFAVYFTSLFDTLMASHLGHVTMYVHFLLVGYLYYWVIIGLDPAPRRLQPMVKLAMLLGALPFHAFFGLAIMNSHTAMATDYYERLGLPWPVDLVDDQQLGGAIAWGATELPIIIVVIALLAQWSRTDEREASRSDRRRDDDSDGELAAYNAMLADLAAGRRPAPTAAARPIGARTDRPDGPEGAGDRASEDPGDRPLS